METEGHDRAGEGMKDGSNQGTAATDESSNTEGEGRQGKDCTSNQTPEERCDIEGRTCTRDEGPRGPAESGNLGADAEKAPGEEGTNRGGDVPI